MRAFLSVAAVMCLAAVVGTFFVGVGELNQDLVIAKAQRVRILSSPVVRVCQDGTFIRSVGGLLFVGDPRNGGWANEGLAADAICKTSTT